MEAVATEVVVEAEVMEVAAVATEAAEAAMEVAVAAMEVVEEVMAVEATEVVVMEEEAMEVVEEDTEAEATEVVVVNFIQLWCKIMSLSSKSITLFGRERNIYQNF